MNDYEAALKHKYRVVSNGTYVPGATTVINVNSKDGLMWSSAKIAATTMYDLLTSGASEGRERDINSARGSFKKEWNAKAARGNRVHEVAEAWTRGETVDSLIEDSGYVDALENFWSVCKPKIHHAERVVLNRWKEFGGRFDFIGELEGHGLVLGDFKTGGKYPYDVALQAAAYLDCELAEYEDGNLSDFTPLPKLDGARTVYLKDDGTFEITDPFEFVSQADATLGFYACLELYKINKHINGLLRKGERNGVSEKS